MLRSIFPQADYAEDQKGAKTILTAHVLYRGFQMGAVLGLGIGLARAIILRRRLVTGSFLYSTIFKSTGAGAAIGTASMVIGLPARMYGRDNIEWNDRSYRLLANKYQEQVDDWTVPSTALGLGATVFKGAVKGPGSWRVVAGGAGLGSLVGLGAMMIFRLFSTTEPADGIRSNQPRIPPRDGGLNYRMRLRYS